MKRRPKVAIISRESDEKTIDVSMLEEELRQRGVSVKVMSKLLTKERTAINAIGYLGQIAKQEAAILRSDVVVLDTYCIPASLLPHRAGTKVVQMWHALGAVKKFGWQTVGKPDGTSERTARLMHMHDGYDYVICPSHVTMQHYQEAFRAESDKMIRLGLPRIDYIKKVTRGEGAAKTKQRVLARYPKLAEAGKRTVLYAPTFRRDGSAPDVQGLVDSLDPSRYNIVVKLHPLYSNASRAWADNIIYDDEFDTYELFAAADAVVSDYSSLVIEATLSEKPLYLYIYDVDEYEKTTGLNIDFSKEAIGGYSFRKAADLAMALEEPYDAGLLRAFGEKYIEIEGAWQSIDNAGTEDVIKGKNQSYRNVCTKELAEFIIGLAANSPNRKGR